MSNSLFGDSGIQELKATGVGLTKLIRFRNVPLENTICQAINASVSVQVAPYYEIGSRNHYRVAGRTSGQGQLQNVMGPTNESLTALTTLCNICKPDDLIVELYNACDSVSGGFIFKDCICTSVTCDANAAQDIVNGSWQLMFSDIEQI